MMQILVHPSDDDSSWVLPVDHPPAVGDHIVTEGRVYAVSGRTWHPIGDERVGDVPARWGLVLTVDPIL